MKPQSSKGVGRKLIPSEKWQDFLAGIAYRNAHWGIPYLFEPMLERIAGRPLEILDVGCGGGWEFLRCYGKVTGVDVSPAALRAAAQVYDQNGQGLCLVPPALSRQFLRRGYQLLAG